MSELGVNAHSQTSTDWFSKKDEWKPSNDGAGIISFKPNVIDFTATGNPDSVNTRKYSLFGC